MGQGGPSKPVTSLITQRQNGTMFRAACAEMNGWRASMEDDNIMYMKDTWGFFGIFDGHGGQECSKFIAARMEQELDRNGMPKEDSEMIDLARRLDKEFIDTKQSSGSTGTFVIVDKGSADGKLRLRVGNVGDSRVLLGRFKGDSGEIVAKEGTDGALTVDHKPNSPSEAKRIEEAGGFVEQKMGVWRVNGDLAVSRAFGDSQYKMPARKADVVSADPEMTEYECDSATDFILLVCDGISEAYDEPTNRDKFPNAEVVKLAAKKMRETNLDLGESARAVCRQAIVSGSKDNLSCMIVLLKESKESGLVEKPKPEFEPGWFDPTDKSAHRKAYEAIASHAGFTLERAVELRYDRIKEALKAWPVRATDRTWMSLKVLKLRALDLGIDKQTVADADDSDDPKQTVIDMIKEAQAAMRAELSGLTLKVLKIKARENGIDHQLICDADDTADPKESVIEMILAQADTASEAQGLRREKTAPAPPAKAPSGELNRATTAPNRKVSDPLLEVGRPPWTIQVSDRPVHGTVKEVTGDNASIAWAEELRPFKVGPPEALSGDERTAWFRQYLEECVQHDD